MVRAEQKGRAPAGNRHGALAANYGSRDSVSSAVKGILVTPQEALAILLLVLLLGAIALAVAVVTILIGIMLLRFKVLPQGIV